MANNPPPYFPQQFSTKDPNRYRKFKLIVFGVATVLTLIAIGAIVGIVYLIKWLV
jgi:hypothetical protein